MPEIRRFPVRPDLSQYKKQAKELKHARGSALTLSEAQRLIALEHGFASWPRFRAVVEQMQAIGLNVGESVTVADGPFAGSEGTVREKFEQRRQARIAVHIEGREVDLWLDERHIERHG